MERTWIFISIVFLLAAAFMIWRANIDAAFVLATLGAVAWFMSYREQLVSRLRQNTEEIDDEDKDVAEEEL